MEIRINCVYRTLDSRRPIRQEPRRSKQEQQEVTHRPLCLFLLYRLKHRDFAKGEKLLQSAASSPEAASCLRPVAVKAQSRRHVGVAVNDATKGIKTRFSVDSSGALNEIFFHPPQINCSRRWRGVPERFPRNPGVTLRVLPPYLPSSFSLLPGCPPALPFFILHGAAFISPAPLATYLLCSFYFRCLLLLASR